MVAVVSGEKRSARERRIEYLANEYLETSRLWRSRGHRIEHDELNYALDQLRQANEVLEFLRATGRDPYATFRIIDKVLDQAHSGLSHARSVFDDMRFLELIDDHFETLMGLLDADALPAREADVLDALGFPNLASSIRERTDLLAA